MLHSVSVIFQKEFTGYFRSRLAYFIIGAYAFLSMLATFYLGAFFDLNNSELFSFFYFQADIFSLLVPALTMRLWADERRSGTMELLLAQPISYSSIVVGKFLSAWVFCWLLLLTSFPFWYNISQEFPLDNLNILSSYLACFLVTGILCALGCAVSAFNKSPVIAYIMTLFICWIVMVGNFDFIIQSLDISNIYLIRMVHSLNFMKHYQDLITGQVGLDNIIYSLSLIFLPLWLNVITVEYKKN